MADEIAQVCTLEFEGIKYAVKGSVSFVSYALRALKAILTWTGEGVGNAFNFIADKKLQHQGEHTYKQIVKLSKDGPPMTINIDDRVLNAALEQATKKGLRYAILADLNASDGKSPVAVPAQDMAAFTAIVQNLLENDISESEKMIKNYDREIRELSEKRLHASPEERATLNTKIENLEQAKAELQSVIEGEKKHIKDGLGMSFMDYLATGKGTEFEKDPDKAMSEYESGVEMGMGFRAEDCLQPVRDPSMMPESKMRFYVPESGITVTREFIVEDGIVHSNYSFKTDSGELHEFTDKDITKDRWNAEVLPELLGKSGISRDTVCRSFDSEERMEAYIKYFNKKKPKSEVRLNEEGELVFSSAEAEKELRGAAEDRLKGMASAKMRDDEVVITVPKSALVSKDGLLQMENDGKTYYFSGTGKGAVDGNNISFSIKKDAKVSVQDNKSRNMVDVKASEVKNILHEARNSAVAGLNRSR